ncbi:MAG: acyltransferase family protein [Blastocatellia bacterium]
MRTYIRHHFARIFELSADQNRLLSMEGLRGLAIALVFLVHYQSLFGVYLRPGTASFRVSDFLHTIGNFGVDLFFILSGYLIYGVALRGRQSWFSFMRRRIQRIYPAYLFVLAIYVFISLWLAPGEKIPREPGAAAIYILQNILLMPGIFDLILPIITVAWSLSFELFFYLTIPLVTRGLRMKEWTTGARRRFFLAAGLLVLPGLSWLYPWSPHPRMVMFIAGILIWEYLREGKSTPVLPAWGQWAAPLACLVVLAPIYWIEMNWADNPAFLPIEPDPSVTIAHTIQIALLCLSFPFLALYCLGHGGWLARAFTWTPLRWMGNMSYSYYLIHGLAIGVLQRVVIRLRPPRTDSELTWFFWLMVPVCFVFTLLVSTVLFVLIEKPFSLSRTGHKTKPQPDQASAAGLFQSAGSGQP